MMIPAAHANNYSAADIARIIGYPAQMSAGTHVCEIARRVVQRPLLPGAHITLTGTGGVLIAIADRHTYIWIDGVKLCHVRGADVWTDDHGGPVVQRPGGALLVVALRLRDGMLVRVGGDYQILAGSDLRAVDEPVYRHLLARRRAEVRADGHA